MEADDITKTIVGYVHNHPTPNWALIPERIPQGILDILCEDCKDLADKALTEKPRAGKYMTTAVLLLLSQRQDGQTIQVTEKVLSQAISRYTQHVYLESLSRKGLIRDLSPELTLENILDPQLKPQFTMTDLGKRALQNKENPLADYQALN